LQAAGIDVARVDLLPPVSRAQYLDSYSQVDILLDTFPYPGGTTTAEALWMGVPTLTLAMPGMLGRQGQAMLSNLGLHVAMREAGITVRTTAVGDRYVLEELRAGEYSLGGEQSGHIVLPAFGTTGDGILSARQVLRVMKEKKATLAELAACMREFPQELVNLKVAAKPPLIELAGIQKLIKEADAAFGDAGRQLIRYSGTENKIRILVEHRDADTVDEWIGKFTQAVKEDIGVPA
jgi:phosphomannomutase